MKDLGELEAELESRGVPATARGLGLDVNEAHCIVEEAGVWHVFYSERGSRNAERVFASEAEACEELARRVLRDGAVRRWIEDHPR